MEGPAYDIQKVRNTGVVAHIDAGKTTLSERILYYSGRIHRMGEVHEGTTEMDWMSQERQRGITITAAATTVAWGGHQLNLIDTPGHVDFTVEVERSLRVLDGAVVVFSGVEGVESQSEAVWHQADRYKVPRVAFVNKLDRGEADFARTVGMMEERLGVVPLVLMFPWKDKDGRLLGLVDVVGGRLLEWDTDSRGLRFQHKPLPDELSSTLSYWRDSLLERLADHCDRLAEKYLAGSPISKEEIHGVVRELTLQRRAVPVLGGSALANVGVQPVLDAVVRYLPAPPEVPPVEGHPPGSSDVVACKADAAEPLAALVFKVAADPYAERLLYVRIYSGCISEGEVVLNADSERRARVVRLFRLHANRRERLARAWAGDIVGIITSEQVLTGDTLCAQERPVVLERIVFPEPVVFSAVEPRSEAEEGKLRQSLERIAQEDPTFQVVEDEGTGQLLVGGMGELQLQVQLHRLEGEFGVGHRVGRPQVAYKQTAAAPVNVVEELSRTLGGRAQYAKVRLDLSPLPRGEGNSVNADVDASELPPDYVEAARRGAQGALGSSPLGGFPVTDVAVEVLGGASHPVDSSEVAFEACATQAVRKGLERAGMKLLEPVAVGDIITPGEYLGEVVSDLGRRRGQIHKIATRGPVESVRVTIPVVETFGYATQLRSLTQGRATCSLRVAHYDVVPEETARDVLRSRGY
ncbi:MAG: elongation factor G [Candidatus Bipolaricaulota bacterium]